MEASVCISCQKPKAHIECGLCRSKVCKTCAQFMSDEDFRLMPERPEELKHDTYCNFCFDNEISEHLRAYNDMVDRAKNISVFFKSHNKETRRIPRIEKPIEIAECTDYNETIMRLAYMAAQNNFNGLIDLEMVSNKKKITGTFFKHVWSGKAIPAHVEERRLVRDRSLRESPN